MNQKDTRTQGPNIIKKIQLKIMILPTLTGLTGHDELVEFIDILSG